MITRSNPQHEVRRQERDARLAHGIRQNLLAAVFAVLGLSLFLIALGWTVTNECPPDECCFSTECD